MSAWQGVQVESGGWMRFEDYCNSTERGAGLMYTSSIIFVSEELAFHELGGRVANAMMEKSIDGWDALLELSAAGG